MFLPRVAASLGSGSNRLSGRASSLLLHTFHSQTGTSFGAKQASSRYQHPFLLSSKLVHDWGRPLSTIARSPLLAQRTRHVQGGGLWPVASNSTMSSVRSDHAGQNTFLALPLSSPNTVRIGSLSFFSSFNSGNESPYSQPPGPHPPVPPPPPPPPNNRRSFGGAVGIVGTGALVLFGKTKYVLAALKLTKLASLGSMLLTVGTYSMFFGVPYAVGMVGLILVHEVGHAAVMYQRGIPFSPMVFVPFMGAAIAMREQPRDAWEDAMVAFGGPVLGSLGALGVGVVGHATQSQLLIALADFGFMINLFNLLPIGSMDGGRIAGALSPYMSVVGLGMGAGLAYTGTIHNPVFYLILLAGGYDTFQRFYNPAAHMPSPNYYKITPLQRTAIGLAYAGLIGSLALAMDINGRYKKPPEVLMREREMEKSWDMR